MPVQRMHGGAALAPINLTAPGFGGLNTESSGSILSPQWATVLDNIVFDSAGRPASRDGFLNITTTPTTGTIKRIFEYWKADTSSDVIFSTDAGIYRNTDAPTAIHGTLSISDGNIQFVNFNDKVIAFGVGTGGIPAVYTSTTFADITVNSGSAPTGGVGTAAFGRIWGVDADGKTLKYSSLLDETRWATDVNGDGGSIDFSKVWPAGQDTIVAITEFMGDLVVFGRNNTLILTDGAGSSLGIDPLALYVSDTIPGLGAVSQFAMCRAAGDYWFLTPAGIVGLRRELQARSTPINNISRNVQSYVASTLFNETNEDDITFVYDHFNDFVVCIFPEAELQFVFDTRMEAPTPGSSGPGYRATTWSAPLSTLAYIRSSKSLYGAFTTVAGTLMQYSGNSDNGSPYAVAYQSGWLDLGQQNAQYLKFVKNLTSFVVVEANVDVVHEVLYDFNNVGYSSSKSASGTLPAEFNIAEFTSSETADPSRTYIGYRIAGDASSGETEYSGSVSLRTLKTNGQGSGQFIKVGIRLDTNSGRFALQQINLYAKIGRMAV